MRRVLSSEQMRRCDEATIQAGTASIVLMERAAEAAARIAEEKFNPRKTLVVCGGGNNGGDGVLCALYLARRGHCADIYFVGDRERVSNETAIALERAEEYIHESSRRTETESTKRGTLRFEELPDYSKYTLIIDAIFGIGLSRPVTGDTADVIRNINSCGADILAIDIPSGISADTGKKTGAAVTADATVAIQAYKFGHTVSDGVDACGKVYAADIGICDDCFPDSPRVCTKEDLKLIPKRRRSANKGTFGRVLVIAGSRGMCGAAYLSALAAYRTGAGIAEIFTPEENRAVLQSLLPEAIVTAYDREDFCSTEAALRQSLQRATVVIIGPGLGQDRMAEFLVENTFDLADAPVIVDADALNAVAKTGIAFPTDIPVIVTPHPGEMSRLTGRQIKELCADPVSFAKCYAAENEVICVLKYARTVVTNGEDVYINTSGGPSLSKGGSGDVLTGVIAGMLCSDLSPIDAATLGVFVHGAAGDVTAEKMGDYSPLAREVANAIPEVLKER